MQSALLRDVTLTPGLLVCLLDAVLSCAVGPPDVLMCYSVLHRLTQQCCPTMPCCTVPRCAVCREILYSLHDELLAKAEGHISALLEMEGDQIWTQNSHYMVSSKQHFEDLLVKQVYGSEAAVEASSSSDEAKKQAINTALAQLASVGMSVSPQLLDLVVAKERQKTAEEDAGLLQLIAGTLAYLKVSWQHGVIWAKQLQVSNCR